MVHEVGEKVSVMAKFKDNRFAPVRFRWGNRVHRLREVTGRWSEHDGQYRIYHFAAVSESDGFYEISFHTRNMEWILDKFALDESGG